MRTSSDIPASKKIKGSMKLNYRIYKKYSGEMPEENTQITEQMILAHVKREYEQTKRIVTMVG